MPPNRILKNGSSIVMVLAVGISQLNKKKKKKKPLKKAPLEVRMVIRWWQGWGWGCWL